MKIGTTILIIILLIVGILGGAGYMVKSVEELLEKLEAAQTYIQELEARNAILESANEKLTTQLNQAIALIASLKANVEGLKGQLIEQRQMIIHLEALTAELKSLVAQHQTTIQTLSADHTRCTADLQAATTETTPDLETTAGWGLAGLVSAISAGSKIIRWVARLKS